MQCLVLCIISLAVFSCSEISFDMPLGPEGPAGLSSYDIWRNEVEKGNIDWPKEKTEIADFLVYIKGEKGDRGEDGLSAYELWKNLISTGEVVDPHNPSEKWDKTQNTESDFWNFLTGRDGLSPHIGPNGNWWIGDKDTHIPAKGKDGIDGVDGKDGITPNIGPNGNWWIGITDTGVAAQGKDGVDGITPHIGNNGNWFIGSKDTGVPAKGKDGIDGITPHLGNNGNWWIGITDTGVAAEGQNGKDGVPPHIGDNGNWWIDTTDTGKPAQGANGKDGLSAYELWKEIAEQGNLDDPKKPGEKWDKEKVGVEHFIQYLTGANGKDGVNGLDGKDGKDGADGETPYINANGNWWIGTTDTGIKAEGLNGKDGVDGLTPHIGANGNWWIGTTDTGTPAKGENGKDGTSPEIGPNGNWWINGVDTGKPVKGEDGTHGKSAYELWVEDVKKGQITDPNTGKPWPQSNITQADFWTYLKGKDGVDGVDGKDGENGINGKSAYEIWKEIAETGTLVDPKNPSVKWPKDKTSETDFWSFLMGKDGRDGIDGLNGKDGQSAYELWKAEVEKGLPNPHESGKEWPKDKTSTNNFWEFLSGKDGKDGIAGKPGEPGQPIEVVTGVPNVIAQYALQEYSEYVRWSDGGVLYKVYDNIGQPAAGAIVKGLPGLPANKEYTADSKGEFLIPKEDLPEGKEVSELVGKAQEVTYRKSTGQMVTEASAANTYIPNRVHIRLIQRSNFTIDSNDVNIYMKTQRNLGLPDSEWTDIPTYLGNLSQRINAYELQDKDDPTSFDETKIHQGVSTSITSPVIYIKRLRLKPSYMKQVSYEWDGKDHYYIIRLESYYGEKAVLPAVIKNVPIQYMPLISQIKEVKGYIEGLDLISSLTVTFDTSEVNTDLAFSSYRKEKTVAHAGIDYDYWTPIVFTNFNTYKFLKIQFTHKLPSGDHTVNNNSNMASIASPESSIANPHASSKVSLSISNTLYLVAAGEIGQISYNKEKNTLNFIGTKNSIMEVPDILDIPVE